MTSSDAVFIVLPGGVCVTQAFFDKVVKHVNAELPKLKRTLAYPSKVLCGEFWSVQDKTQHVIIGKCIAYAVVHGMLPLAFAGRTDANAKLYRLK
mgnify:CR=1 FL=1